MDPVNFDDVLKASEIVYKYLPQTPLYYYQGLSEMSGCKFYLKHENHLPTGAFKVRGGINIISSLSKEERKKGVISATRGNHGLSIGFASKIFCVKAYIVVPENNNPEKNNAMKRLGIELIIFGNDFDDAREKAEILKSEYGLRYIHSANEPFLIAGVGTYALEIFKKESDIDYIFVPIGLGSGISGVSIVRNKLSPKTKIIGVQAENAPSVFLSWKEKEIVKTESSNTIADGLATRVPAEMTLEFINKYVDDIILISEEEIKEGMKTLIKETHNLAEGAGAASTTAIIKIKDKIKNKKVVSILSGCNINSDILKGLF
jgi:threonine dehydratase